jgi:hypothetical protein
LLLVSIRLFVKRIDNQSVYGSVPLGPCVVLNCRGGIVFQIHVGMHFARKAYNGALAGIESEIWRKRHLCSDNERGAVLYWDAFQIGNGSPTYQNEIGQSLKPRVGRSWQSLFFQAME